MTHQPSPERIEAFHEAARAGNFELLQEMLTAGMPVDAVGSHGHTALMTAASNKRPKAVRLLLERGANPNARRQWGQEPVLCFACQHNHAPMVRWLLEAGADPNTSGRAGLLADSPLCLAAVLGHAEVVQALLEGGANPNYVGGSRRRPLSVARDPAVRQLLQDAGARDESEVRSAPPPKQLAAACQLGRLDRVDTLLAAGVPLDTQDGNGRSLLGVAVSHGQIPVVRRLLDAGLSAQQCTAQGEPLLVWAAFTRNADLVRLLLEQGVPVDHTDENGCTALMAAALSASLEIVELLLAAGADPHRRGRFASKTAKTAYEMVRRMPDRQITERLAAALGVDPPPAKPSSKGLAAAGEEPAFQEVLRWLGELGVVERDRRRGVYKVKITQRRRTHLADRYRQDAAFTAALANESDETGREAMLLGRLQQEVFEAGFHLVRRDVVGAWLRLYPTSDKYVVLAAAGTSGINYGHTNADVIEWLQKMEQDHPWVLTGCSYDFVEGRFLQPPADANALAERMYQFCPDIVDQGCKTVAALAGELEQQALYFWWD